MSKGVKLMKLMKCPTLVTGGLMRVLGSLTLSFTAAIFCGVRTLFGLPLFEYSVGYRQNGQNQSPQIYATNGQLLFTLDGYADRNDHEVHETYVFIFSPFL